MSGIEVAGLVLGAIPLAVKAFKVYAETVSTVSRYRRYKHSLKDLYHEIDSEYNIYLNTCEQLLDGIVDDNTQKVVLLGNPGGDEWRDHILEEGLKARMAGSYGTFMWIMESMRDAVEEMKALLKLGPDGNVQLKSGSKFKDELRRIRFSIQASDYEELMARITRYNMKLSKLTEQNRSLESSRQLALRSPPDFRLIKKAACDVYNVLNGCLQCGPTSCAATHSVSLNLKNYGRGGASHDGQKSGEASTFSVVVSYCSKFSPPKTAPWRLEALDVRRFIDPPTPTPVLGTEKPQKKVAFTTPDGDGPPTKCSALGGDSNLARIDNLCQEFHRLRQGRKHDWAGHLEDKIARRKVAVLPKTHLVNPASDSSMSSLQNIITGSIAGTTPISWSCKLRIALIMASSLLQLQGTPWLSEDWSKEEIGVLCGVEGEIHTKLFISKSCGSLPQQLPSPSTVNGPRSWEGIRSRPLFTLGVLLIELCIGKPFEELRRRQRICSTPSDCQESTLLDLTVADEYVDWCYQDRGPHYGDVVRRCIWCSFDTRKVGFDDAQFQQAVYHGVVAPLQEDVKNFASLSI